MYMCLRVCVYVCVCVGALVCVCVCVCLFFVCLYVCVSCYPFVTSSTKVEEVVRTGDIAAIVDVLNEGPEYSVS